MVSRVISAMRIAPTAMLNPPAARTMYRLSVCFAEVTLNGRASNSVKAAMEIIVPTLNSKM